MNSPDPRPSGSPRRSPAPLDAESALDVRLTALLDGECGAAERRELRRHLRRDREARTRYEVLRAADRALRAAFEEPRQRAWRPQRGLWVAAAAAAVVVSLVLWQRGSTDMPSDGTAAANGHVELRIAPRGGGSQPLFTDLQLDLYWRSLDGRELEVLPLPLDADPGTLTPLAGDGAVLPLWLGGTVTGPDGRARAARYVGPALRVPADDAGKGHRVVPLRHFELAGSDPGPVLCGRPGEPPAGSWSEDFRWALGAFPADEAPRWFPDHPGSWSLGLEVHAVPPAGPDPWFEPLQLRVEVLVTGSVSEWSGFVDGMRVRLVSPGAGGPLGLQIDNQSGRARRYNVCGITAVPIPQPLHLSLWVDGVAWEQRDDLGVIVSAYNTGLVHPDDTVRTVVVAAGCWRDERGGTLGERPGAHRLQLQLHSRMLVAVQGDPELWEGELRTPPLAVDLPAGR